MRVLRISMVVLVALIALAIWISFGRVGAPVGLSAIDSARPVAAPAIDAPLASVDGEVERAVVEDVADVTIASRPARLLRDDDPMALLRMRVVDAATRTPMSDVDVTIHAQPPAPPDGRTTPPSRQIGFSLTGADGTVLQMIEPGWSAHIVAAAPHARLGHTTVTPLTASEERDVTIEVDKTPDVVLCGRVTARDTGLPLANAIVTLEAKHEAVAVAADGSFRAEMYAWRDSRIEVRAPGYATGTAVRAPGHETPERAVDIALDRAATLRVTVLDAEGTPVPIVTAKLQSEGYGPVWERTTSPAGVAEWTDLPPGVALRAKVLRYSTLLVERSEPIVLTAGEAREATWNLPPLSAIHGVVLENGVPVAKQEVWLQLSRGEREPILRDDGGEKRKQVSDESGRFRFTQVRPGSWWLAPGVPDFRQADPERDPIALAQAVEISSESSGDLAVDVHLQRGLVIRGRVVTPDGTAEDEPRSRTHVSARPADKSTKVVTARVAKDGTFVIGPLLPGPWNLAAAGSGRYRQSEFLLVDAGATEVVLRLQPAVDLRVTVLDTSGKPVPDVDVRAWQAPYPPIWHRSDSNGLAAFGGWFRPGIGSIGCLSRDGRWGLVTDVRMDLDRPVEVELRLQPGVQARIRSEVASGTQGLEILRDGISLGLATLVNGRETAVTLPVGRVTLRAFVTGTRMVEHELVVAAGTSPELTFDGAWR